MMYLLNQFPVTSRYVVAILLFALALMLSTLIDGPILKQYFPYVSAISLFLVTWFLFKLDKKKLEAIGLKLTLRNVSFIFFGLFLGVIVFLVASFARAIYTGETIIFSSVVDYRAIIISLYFILPTVAVEELLFRGYLFKKTIAISNVVVANIVFSVLFTLIHIADESVMSNSGHLVILLMSIPVGHLFFATALLRSRTLFFPIGLHLGNNWATRHLISSQGEGQSILVVLDRVNFDTWPTLIGFLLIFNGVFLLATSLIWKWGKWRSKGSSLCRKSF